MTDWENNEKIIAIKKDNKIRQDRIKEVKRRIEQKQELTEEDLELIRQAIDIQAWWQKMTGRLKN